MTSPADKRENVARSAGKLGLATMLSRFGGLARDMVIAVFFGAGYASDAFFVAFTLPNLLRRFFAEGSLTSAFVPVYSEVFHRDGVDEARLVAQRCWNLLALVMVVVVVSGIAASPWLVRMIGYGFADLPGKLELTNQLNRWMFPYIACASLLSLVTGVLNVRGHFFLPAVSPLLLNLAIIAAALLLAPQLEEPVMALAYGVLAGGFLQLLLQLPLLRRCGWVPRFGLAMRHPAVTRIAGLMLPGIAGVAIYQINVIITRLLATFLPEGSVSYLYFGQRLFEFPQGIIIASLGQALLPELCRQAATGEKGAMGPSLGRALQLLQLVLLPAMVGLVLCAEPVYFLFFGHGAFDATAVHQTAVALVAYAPGLLFVGVSRLLVPVFYAMQDTRTPVWVSFWTLLANAGFGLLLMGPLQHVGLALALTLSSAVNSLLLLWLLRDRVHGVGWQALCRSLLRLLPGLALMTLLVYSLLSLGDWAAGNWLGNLILLLVAVVAGAGSYLGCAWLLRAPGLDQLLDMLPARLRRRVVT